MSATLSPALPEYCPAASSVPDLTRARLACVAGLLSAATVEVLLRIARQPFRISVSGVRDGSAFFVLVAFAAAWGAARIVARSQTVVNARELALRVGLTATWVAPTVLFFFDRSAWTVIAIAALAVSAFRINRWISAFSAPTQESLGPQAATPMFSSFVSTGLRLDLAAAICAGLLIDSTAAAAITANVVIAAALGAVAAWMVLRRAHLLFAPAPPAPLSNRRISTHLSLAAMFTLLALLPHMVLPGQFSDAEIGGSRVSVISAIKALLGLWNDSGGKSFVVNAGGTGTTSNGSARIPGHPYPAVILFDGKPQNVVQLIAPPPSAFTSTSGHFSEPLTIPFSGVYWLLRSPSTPPGPDALVQAGTPAKLGFLSNDFTSLWMEAHQKLGTSIDTRCCRTIRLGVTDNDFYSHQVQLEVVLTDSGLREHSSETLGVQPVATLKPEGNTRPEPRLLSFEVPRGGLDRFDEVTVRYWLERGHRLRSARISIDKFVLVPR